PTQPKPCLAPLSGPGATGPTIPLSPQVMLASALYLPRSAAVASALVMAGMTGDISVSPMAKTTVQPTTPAMARAGAAVPARPAPARMTQERAKMLAASANARVRLRPSNQRTTNSCETTMTDVLHAKASPSTPAGTPATTRANAVNPTSTCAYPKVISTSPKTKNRTKVRSRSTSRYPPALDWVTTSAAGVTTRRPTCGMPSRMTAGPR